MKDIYEMSLDEIKALEDSIKARKAELKDSAKSAKKANDASTVDNVNEMISNHTLDVGMNVIVNYMGEEVTGKIVGVLSLDKKSLTVESVAFKSTKPEEADVPKRRYIDKSMFVRIA